MSGEVMVNISGPHALKSQSIDEVMGQLGAQRDEPMSRHTTIHIGGLADWFLEAQNLDDIIASRLIARSREIPVTMIGNGSNMLVSDNGVRGLVIKPSASLATIAEFGPKLLHVGAGVKVPELARYYRDKNAGGLEWGFGVPGCVGGALFMNAGTRDGEIKDVVESVTVIGRGARVDELPAASCDFSYRKSRFQRTGECIVCATLRMPEVPFDAVKSKRTMEDRKRTQPLHLPNFGSVFTNPPGDYAARLIEQCGMKGRSIGGAQISPIHANFIVNNGNASASEAKALMDLCVTEVRRKFNIVLHSEVRMIGEF